MKLSKHFSIFTRFLALALIAFGLILSQPAAADALDDALAAGTVGETPRGYIAAVGATDPTVTALVNDINAKRRAKYQELAAKHGTSLEEIEALIGKRVIERAPAGTNIMAADGKWVRK